MADTSQRELQARDLLEHPGWKDVEKDIAAMVTSAKKKIFNTAYPSAEAQGLATEGSRQVLHAMHALVLGVHKRANVELPDHFEALF